MELLEGNEIYKKNDLKVEFKPMPRLYDDEGKIMLMNDERQNKEMVGYVILNIELEYCNK